MTRRLFPLLLLCVSTAALAAPAAREDAPRRRIPSAPPGKKQEGPSGELPKDGKCPEDLKLLPRGGVMRMGPGTNFGVARVQAEDRCLPIIRESDDGNWLLLETDQGKAAWFRLGSTILEFANPPPLAEGESLFDAVMLEEGLAQAAPSLVAPVTTQLHKGEVLQVRGMSEDGLFLLCARDGVSVGWVLKLTTQHSLDLEERVGGSRPWAPPPTAPELLSEGSPDAPLAPAPPAATETAAAPKVPDEKNPDESLVARGEQPAPVEQKKTWKDRLGILNGRPAGRGLTVGVGPMASYFFQRFQSNAFNDGLSSYRLDSLLGGLQVDVEYHAPFGLVVGARLGGNGFTYTDYTFPALARLPRPLGNGADNVTAPDLKCAYPAPGILGQVCPLPSLVHNAQFYAGWRVYGSPEMDVSIRMNYASEFVLFGKPSNREAFSDLWYHSLRPSARAVWRPLKGRFGALSSDVGMGAGFVVPLVLRPRQCTGICPPLPRDVLEQTYTLQTKNGNTSMVRSGYARPPNFVGLDLRSGYLFEVPYFQVEVGGMFQFHYYGVFYTAAEGFAKRNRCCDRGYYDRATNVDVFVGPYLMTRLAL